MTVGQTGAAPSSGATGIILAGGQSQRMGEPKAALWIAGEPLLRRITTRLLLAMEQVLVIGPPDLSQLVPGLPVLVDLHRGIGPLAGIEAALCATNTELIFVVACDMPFINPELVKAMLRFAVDHSEADVVALSGGSPLMERYNPLHAVYRKSCLPEVTRRIESGHYALFQLLAQLRVQEFPQTMVEECDPSGLSTLNANSPLEWKQALALATSLPSPLDQTH